jgi:hypothetical protein
VFHDTTIYSGDVATTHVIKVVTIHVTKAATIHLNELATIHASTVLASPYFWFPSWQPFVALASQLLPFM